MSSDDRPELRAVSEDEVPETEQGDVVPEPVSEAPEPKRGGRGWLSVLLILALVAACLGYLYEEQRAREFETRVTALQTELQEARQDLRAHEERMQVVRGHVDDLAGRVGLLQQTIAIDAE